MPVEVNAATNGAAPDQPEVVFLPSGKIKLQLELEDEETGATSLRIWVLKRPKFGQLKRLREMQYEQQDAARTQLIEEARKRSEEVTAQAAEVVAAADSPAGANEAMQATIDALVQQWEVLKESRKQVAETEDGYLSWSRAAIKMLSGEPLDLPDDECPYILATGDFAGACNRHWRSIPFGSGATPAPSPLLGTATGR